MQNQREEARRGPTDAAQALQALARFPDRDAFAWEGGRMRYAEAAALIGGMQRALEARGVGMGERVAILSSNRAEYWCAAIAAQALGAVVSNLHPKGPRADHAERIAELAPRAVIVDAGDHGARAAELARDLPGPAHLTLGGGGPEDLLRIARARPEPPRDLSRPDLPGTLNFTGGTTGRPKPVIRSAGALGAITRAILADFDLPETPRYLAVAPISHVGGTKIIPVLMRGGTVFMMRKFDAGAVLKTIARERIDMTLMVPTMIYALLDHPEVAAHDLSSLKRLFYGAAPMAPARLAEGIDRFGPVFAQLYGQTECYPIAVLGSAEHDPARPDILAACGRPVSCAAVRLLGPDGREAPQGEPGEICVRAPMVMDGYLDRPEETARALAGAWLHTGDVAVADASGRLTIVDRKKDMIVTGGFNVYPKEVENLLCAQPDVAMAAVIGVPDDKWGEAVAAFVVPRGGGRPDPDALRAFIREEKGAVHAPKAVHVVEALPLTALGKIDKVALRAPFWAGRARMV